MNESSLLTVMTVFVVISAIALLVQAGMLFGMYMATRRMQEQVMPLVPRVQALVETANGTLAENRQSVQQITTRLGEMTGKANEIAAKASDMATRANELLDISKAQAVKIDALVTDASARARVQMDRAELVLDDTMGRVQESVTTVHHGVMKPLREVAGVANGVKAAVATLLKGPRPSVDQVTQDEEMFI